MSDIFVALPPTTPDGCVVFAKNSDRPCSEVQEVVYLKAKESQTDSKVKCTYIEIEEVSKTHAVILSKPAWMWGAEMGSNDLGVCVGNVNVWTKVMGPKDLEKKLLGTDMVRLALERSSSAREAIDVITGLLEKYGQGGPYSDEPGVTAWTSHNSFVTADRQEAWLLETAGSYWAAQKVNDGMRNVSSSLSIETRIDLKSPGLVEKAQAAGLYTNTDEPFNFKQVFSEAPPTDLESSQTACRSSQGRVLLEQMANNGKIGMLEMCKLLQNEESGIAMKGIFSTMGSQISILPPPDSSCSPCHWFTATPDPTTSIFKPFMFSPNVNLGDLTTAEEDGKHKLFKGHDVLMALLEKDDPKGHMILQNLKEMEENCIQDVEEMMKNFDETVFMKVSQIFFQMCNLELNFYKM